MIFVNLKHYTFNSIHRTIKFTREIELNSQIDFLDVLIKKTNDKFLTTVYRKTTFKDNYLNFQSHCNKWRKVGLIKTLYHRTYQICSPEFFNDEIKNIKEILRKNGYAETLVKRVIESQSKRMNHLKYFGRDKCPVVLQLPNM